MAHFVAQIGNRAMLHRYRYKYFNASINSATLSKDSTTTTIAFLYGYSYFELTLLKQGSYKGLDSNFV